MRILVYGCAGHLLGGIETFLLNMNAHMSDQCIFDYIILGADCIHGQTIGKKGGRVFMLPSPRKKPVVHFRRLWKVLGDNRHEYDIVYFNLFSMVNVLPVWMCRLRGYQVILHAHNNGLPNKGRFYTLLHGAGKCLLRAGNYTHWTNSRESSDFMFGKGVDSKLIYNAIDVEPFAFDRGIRDRYRAENNVGHQMVMGFVGRLVDQKHPLFLVEVFHEVLALRPDTVLWVIGEGELEASMRARAEHLGIANRIRWFGHRSDVARLMMAMDVFVLPSIFEGLGIVLIEAQATGLPCVTSVDVVPNMVKITEGLQFVMLDAGPGVWARAVVNGVPRKERERGCATIADSPFNIHTEVRRMEKMLEAIALPACGNDKETA